MYTPHAYPVALLMMLVSMLCWGSWANTQKIDKSWRFELFYWDYMWGILACALLFGLTMGRTDPGAPVSFVHNLNSASSRSLGEAFVGGMIFNLGNLLLVAAISIAGMAVAFPLGAGLALVDRRDSQLHRLAGRQSAVALRRDSVDLRCDRRQRHGLPRTVERREGGDQGNRPELWCVESSSGFSIRSSRKP